jgi:hypothetical protein
MRTIIAPTTDAITEPVALTENGGWTSGLPLTIAASGLGPGESVNIYFHDGTDWIEAYRNENRMKLTNTHNVEVLPGGLKWGITKTATANPVKVVATQHYE